MFDVREVWDRVGSFWEKEWLYELLSWGLVNSFLIRKAGVYGDCGEPGLERPVVGLPTGDPKVIGSILKENTL